MKPIKRCAWAGTELLIPYHDQEWGVPQHDDNMLFEFLVLEGAQAGLSWSTILAKRDAYRKAFSRFIPKKVAAYGPEKVSQLLADAGIVRNRMKIESAIRNAHAFLQVQKEFGNFDRYIWQFVGGSPVMYVRRSNGSIPAQTPESIRMSKDLIQRGFSFVGPTVCYAFMQAVGMVNDHLVHCFRHAEISAMAAQRKRPPANR